jgi:hypothetical protein
MFKALLLLFFTLGGLPPAGSPPETGSLRGKLKLPAGASAPPRLEVQLLAGTRPLARARSLPPCELEPDGRFRCPVPTGTLDLRLRAEPYLTHYRWGQRVERGKTIELGELVLRRGSALVGQVVSARGEPLPRETTLLLEAAGLASDLPDAVHPAALKTELEGDPPSFFHFDGLSPGTYRLTAKAPGLSSVSTEIEVLADREQLLPAPLVLAPPEELTVQIDPPQDPFGDPWQLIVSAGDRRRQVGAEVRSETVPLDGFARIAGLAKGKYLLSIRSSAGKVWLRKPIDLGEEPMPLTVKLEPVEVRGCILLGGDPVPAKAWFGGRFGGIEMDPQPETVGCFQGLLPRPGEWKVDINGDEPRIRSTLVKVLVEPKKGKAWAEVNLELPDTLARVRVVDEAGKPIARAALVTLTPPNLHETRGTSQAPTDADGWVVLRGLPEGTYTAEAAASEDRQSEATTIVLTEKTEPPTLGLVVRSRRSLLVRVEEASGLPVPVAGARLLLTQPDNPTGVVLDSLTGADGQATLGLLPQAQALTGLVIAPGLGTLLARHTLPPKPEPLIVRLSREQGTLRLRLPAATSDPENPPQASLAKNGATVPAGFLHWLVPGAQLTGAAKDELVLPGMAPGTYRLCSRPPDGADLCSEGTLLPGSQLSLRSNPSP